MRPSAAPYNLYFREIPHSSAHQHWTVWPCGHSGGKAGGRGFGRAQQTLRRQEAARPARPLLPEAKPSMTSQCLLPPQSLSKPPGSNGLNRTNCNAGSGLIAFPRAATTRSGPAKERACEGRENRILLTRTQRLSTVLSDGEEPERTPGSTRRWAWV